MNSTETRSEILPTQPPIAVVGISALFPKAANTEDFWSNIRRGVDAITEVPASHWNPDDYFDQNQKTADMTYARRGGFLDPLPFDPLEFGISPNNLEAIDTSQLLGMVGAKRALEHAGYGAGRQFDRSRVGCILGVTGTLEMVIPLGARLGHPRWRRALKDAGVADDVAEDVVNRISQSYVPWQENSFPGLLGNVVAGRIANRLDLHGTNCVVDAACASSLSAIHLAALELWTGRSDMVVSGGIDTFNDIFMFMCFSKTPALSPSGDAKPFSDEADGTILGEGVGIVVLKRLADAERDGDRIYAILKGIGTSSDGAGNAVYAPKAEGQIRCLQDAYRVSGVSPDTIELVEAHGTGTKVGDATEVSGLMQVYQSTGRKGAWCAVGSIKSQIGHTKAAAGSAGILKAILALQHRVLPPTIKVNRPPAAMLAADSPFYVNTEARPWLKPIGYPRRAAVSAFGFGGSNFHCVLEESPQNFDEPDWDGDVQVVALSAATSKELSEVIRSRLVPFESAAWPKICELAAASRESFRVEQPQRILFVLERDKSDFAKLVASGLTMLENYPEKESWSTPDGAFYGREAKRGKLGVLFPGQGSQYVGMLRELACRFPVMNEVISEANAVYSSANRVDAHSVSSKRLSDFIFPHPTFSAEARGENDAALRATQIAQPAIGAVSLAALAVLDQFGVRPEAVAGHSYGELTALCASQRFAPQALYRLSMLRGQLMANVQDVDGGMLAVGAPLTQVEAAIKELSVDLVIANHNSPNQIVLSGRLPEIDRATELFARRNIRGKKLAVAAAFHSPMVAPASAAFRPMLDEIDFAPSCMPVYANSTAEEYPSDPRAARDLLASQLARPVNFVTEIERMYSDGVRTFLEVGPGGVLTSLVNSILKGQDFRAIAIDSSIGKRSGMFDLASALAQLSALGQPIRWNLWDPRATVQNDAIDSRRLRIPISGANYVKPRPPIPPRTPDTATAEAAGLTNKPQPPLPMIAPNPELFAKKKAEESLVAQRPAVVTEKKRSQENRSVMDDGVNVPMPTRDSIPREVPRIANGSPSSDMETKETIRQTLEILQRMQEETARLHQAFLEGQAAALRTFEQLTYKQLGGSQAADFVREPQPRSSDVQTSYPESSHAKTAVFQEPVRNEISKFEPSTVASLLGMPNVEMPSPIAVSPVMPPPPAINKPPRTEERQTLIAPASPPVVASPLPKAQVVVPPVPSLPSLGSTVLAVVSEKTGYPTEMLNLDMSLDHDLGIDSIKRVEILSALQERVPHLPAFQPDELGSLHTLRDVVTLADARAPQSPEPAPSSFKTDQRTNGRSTGDDSQPQSQRAQIQPVAVSPAPIQRAASLLGPTVLAVVSEKTGYPTEMLNLDMSLDHDLGIDSIKRVEILSALQERVPNLPAFQPEELGALHTLRDVVELADARSAGSPTAAATVTSASLQTPVHRDETVSVVAPVSTGSPKAAQRESLGSIVLEVVSEKTGYPVEMLNLDMSLDHDLGIDSIKRVEILSALQERVSDLPAFQPEELGALHTLRDVVALSDSRAGVQQPTTIPSTKVEPLAAVSAPPSPQPVAVPSPLDQTHRPASHVSESNYSFAYVPASKVKRSIVRPTELPPAAMRPLIGVHRGSEVWITEDGSELSLRIANELLERGLKPRIVRLDDASHAVAPEVLAGLIVVALPQGMTESDLWNSVVWLQKVGPTLRRCSQTMPTFFATVSRLDGQFGFEGRHPLKDPISGGLAGIAKCAAREWPEIISQAFDVSETWSATHVPAAMLVTELLHKGPVEVGISPGGSHGLEVVQDSLTYQNVDAPIAQGDVVVVSGGARGVTAEAAFAIARAWRPQLVILGRSPEPAPEPDWLVGISTEAEIQRELIARSPAGTTPKSIAAQREQILAGREVAHQLRRLRSLGISVTYRSVDVRNRVAVRSVLEPIQQQLGPVRGLIHGAGVLADQKIEEKTREQFDRVYQTKIAGLKLILDCVQTNELRFLGLFSSYTARFGRTGQMDYAIANEVLNKQARNFAVQHPRCRVASFNWGPWDGGMVQGGLKKLFAAEGVGLIPLEAGADVLVREFGQTTSRPVEVLILATDDSSEKPKLASTSPSPPANAPIAPKGTVEVGSNVNGESNTDLKVAYERELDLSRNSFLESHVIGGLAVLPVAVVLEWLAHGAMHRNPGLELRGIDDLRIYNGVRVGFHDQIPLKVLAGKTVRQGDSFATQVQLLSIHKGKNILHAGGNVVLSTTYPDVPAPSLRVAMRPYSMDVLNAYESRLFHGELFRGILDIESCSEEGIEVTSRAAPNPWSWMMDPARGSWLADPLAIDVALQAIILWSQELRGKPCLPCAVTKYRQFRRTFPKDGVRIVARMSEVSDRTIRCNVEILSLHGLLIARMEGCESVADASLAAAFRRNRIES